MTMTRSITITTLAALLALVRPALAQIDNAPAENATINWTVASVLIIAVLIVSMIRSKREHRD